MVKLGAPRNESRSEIKPKFPRLTTSERLREFPPPMRVTTIRSTSDAEAKGFTLNVTVSPIARGPREVTPTASVEILGCTEIKLDVRSSDGLVEYEMSP